MSVADRLRRVEERIAEGAVRSGRVPAAVTLVGVSKGVEAGLVAEAVTAGLANVGENRVQEAATKIPNVNERAPVPPRWHLVGHLQSNKARAAVGLFDVIQSVDSLAIAEKISRVAVDALSVFLEVQFAPIPGRFGFDPDGVAIAFEDVRGLPKLVPRGLMTVAPLGLDPDGTRQVFRRLRERRDQLQEDHPEMEPLDLSMGMSEDFVLAVEEGATVVRIGRAIFGS